MPDNSIHAATPDSLSESTPATGEAPADPETEPSATGDTAGDAQPERRSGRRRDWRLGGRTVARWREWTLGVAILALGVAIVAGAALTAFVAEPWTGMVATALLWAGMLVGIVWAFSRSRPVGLLRLGAADVLFGLALGILLRLAQGWLEIVTGGSGALPSYPTIGGALPDGFVFAEVVSPVVIAPVLEEFFFRGVILVCLYTLLRRPFGKLMAGIAAAVASAGLFVLVHALTLTQTTDQVISLALLGLVCAMLVLLTGRIWSAVLTHVVYNGTYVVLALVGTYWG